MLQINHLSLLNSPIILISFLTNFFNSFFAKSLIFIIFLLNVSNFSKLFFKFSLK